MEEKTYIQKLQDPRWQRKRLEIMQRDDFKCRHCEADDKPLQIHHIAYNFKDPWDIEDRLLISLCNECHDIETGAVKEAFAKLIQSMKMAGYMSLDVLQLQTVFQDSNIRGVHPNVHDLMISAASDFKRFYKRKK